MSRPQEAFTMKMTQETDVLKREDCWPVFAELKATVLKAAQTGSAIHEVEELIWKLVLQIGRQALEQFLSLVGTGDQGEAITLPDGHCCQRLEQTHERRYLSIFGEFVLRRAVYGSREGQ